MLATKILALLVMLVPPAQQKHNGEDEAAALARYGIIANAISVEAAADDALALFLVTTARHESSFSIKVHDGRRRGDCEYEQWSDGKLRIAPGTCKSWGLFQINCGKSRRAKCPSLPYRANEIIGTDEPATERATKAGATHLRKHIKGCKGRPLCVFRGYVGAPRGPMSKRVASIVLPRVWTYRRLVAKAKK